MKEKLISLCERYADISAQMKKLEKDKKELSQLVLEEMNVLNLPRIEGEFGTVSKTSKMTYKYSSNVAKLQKTIKEYMQVEVENGVAVPKESVYITLRT